jgi:IrrE N-terminal-like domain
MSSLFMHNNAIDLLLLGTSLSSAIMLSATSTAFIKPSPANLTKQAVDKFAGEVAQRLGYTPGADLEAIVTSIGGQIRYDTWEHTGEDGSLEVYPGSSPSFVIRLAAFNGNLRNRFTIAHELGHYFLHSGGGKKPIRVARADSGRLEWEANWFAAAFLLPADQFIQDWTKYGKSAARLVSVYKVSEAVVDIRLENLQLK